MWSVYLVLLLLAAVLLFAARFVVRALWRGGAGGRAALAVGLVLGGWAVYRVAVPSEAAYLDEFARLSGVRLPDSVRIVERDATFPNHRGEYSACFIARVPAAQVPALQTRLGTPVAGAAVKPCRPFGNAWAPGSAAQHYEISSQAPNQEGRVGVTLDAAGWLMAEWRVRKRLKTQ